MNLLEKNKLNIIVYSFLVLGILLSIIRSSNFSDGDSFDVIMTFLNFIDYGVYTPSRAAYGHLVPEFIIGFFAYNFGIPVSNIVCFLFFFSSILLLTRTFKFNNLESFFFYTLCFSNFLLFIENTNSIDYSIALFFFVVSIFFIKKENFFLTSIFFGLTIISRANFIVFIYPTILIFFLYKGINKKNILNFLFIIFFSTFIGLLFFIPTYVSYDYSLKFIKIPFITNSNTPGWYGGPEFNLLSLSSRFFYKIFQIVGVFSSFIFLYLLFFNLKKIFNIENFDRGLCILIIFLNLLLFFFMPVKTLLLNPFIIFSYILLVKYFKKNILIAIIGLNLFQWIISYDFLEIKYKNQELCFAKEAISASLNFELKEGGIIYFFSDSNNLTKCYSKFMREYSFEFENNLPLRHSK